MASQRQHRKSRFLKAFVRIGTISGAAKASRISRDAVHDWLNTDESFVRQYAHAKRRHNEEPFRALESSLIFFTDIVRPLVDRASWPRVATALAIAVANLKNDLKGGRRLAGARSGEVTEVSLSPHRFGEVAIPNRGREHSVDDL